MPRIHGVPRNTRNPLLRLIFGMMRRRFGKPVEPMYGYALSGGFLAGMMGLELGMERAKRVDERLKGLAEVRVAALVECPFCLDIGSAIVTRLGVPAAQIRDLNRYEESPAFTELERLVLRYADAMAATPVRVDDELVGALREHLDERQLVELTAAIGLENLRARVNHALGYKEAGFSQNGVCALPASTPQRAVA
jgi:AhpD family alkylhydroperoxidase